MRDLRVFSLQFRFYLFNLWLRKINPRYVVCQTVICYNVDERQVKKYEYNKFYFGRKYI